LSRQLTIAPAATSIIVELVFWKAFHTPIAVPSMASFPTKTGIAQRKVMALEDKANDEIRMGASGWTVVKPIRTNTTM